MVKRPSEGLLAGLWEFPCLPLKETEVNALADGKGKGKGRDEVRKGLVTLLTSLGMDLTEDGGIRLEEEKRTKPRVHLFSHIRMTYHTMYWRVRGRMKEVGDTGGREVRWVNMRQMEGMGIPTGVKKCWDDWLAQGGKGTTGRMRIMGVGEEEGNEMTKGWTGKRGLMTSDAGEEGMSKRTRSGVRKQD